MVASSIVSCRATIGASASRFSMSVRRSGVHERFVAIATSAPTSARDSWISVPRTVWMI